MTDLVEVDETDPRVAQLRRAMSQEVGALYGDARHDAPAEALDSSTVVVTVLALDGEEPVATAALRRLGDDLELKRMVVLPVARGTGLSRRLLAAMEQHARELGGRRLLLHTGERQLPALALYRRAGYQQVPVFEPYLSVPESVCFAKDLCDDDHTPRG